MFYLWVGMVIVTLHNNKTQLRQLPRDDCLMSFLEKSEIVLSRETWKDNFVLIFSSFHYLIENKGYAVLKIKVMHSDYICWLTPSPIFWTHHTPNSMNFLSLSLINKLNSRNSYPHTKISKKKPYNMKIKVYLHKANEAKKKKIQSTYLRQNVFWNTFGFLFVVVVVVMYSWVCVMPLNVGCTSNEAPLEDTFLSFANRYKLQTTSWPCSQTSVLSSSQWWVLPGLILNSPCTYYQKFLWVHMHTSLLYLDIIVFLEFSITSDCYYLLVSSSAWEWDLIVISHLRLNVTQSFSLPIFSYFSHTAHFPV
jgi:hypothetical protein